MSNKNYMEYDDYLEIPSRKSRPQETNAFLKERIDAFQDLKNNKIPKRRILEIRYFKGLRM